MAGIDSLCFMGYPTRLGGTGAEALNLFHVVLVLENGDHGSGGGGGQPAGASRGGAGHRGDGAGATTRMSVAEEQAWQHAARMLAETLLFEEERCGYVSEQVAQLMQLRDSWSSSAATGGGSNAPTPMMTSAAAAAASSSSSSSSSPAAVQGLAELFAASSSLAQLLEAAYAELASTSSLVSCSPRRPADHRHPCTPGGTGAAAPWQLPRPLNGAASKAATIMRGGPAGVQGGGSTISAAGPPTPPPPPRSSQLLVNAWLPLQLRPPLLEAPATPRCGVRCVFVGGRCD
jgi:hypothetical protein